MAYSIYIKLMFTTVGCFENAILLQLPGFTSASSFPYSNCVILVVRSKFLSLCKTNKLPCKQRFLFVCLYPASTSFSLAWFLAFTMSFASLSCRVVIKKNRLRDRHTTDASDIVNAKNHAREKPVLAGCKQTNKQTKQSRQDGFW